ncbi:AAA family ATPase [Sphingomonas yabuuchiae]|uniref:AAA family ATPase n=1 Tax=Sphingomonas yabuuchiae TaxID=172044 RepID=UPI0025E3D88F|nr:AAA family ATPase [uncultured Sphingomonas sp.]
MDNLDILARFDGNGAFRAARARWSDEATEAFCTIALAAHDAGLDWWFVDKPPYEVRCGRRDAGRVRATAVLGYIGEPGPWFGVNEIQGPQYLTALALPPERWTRLDTTLAERFAALAARPDFAVHWRFGADARPGRWPNDSIIETGTSMDMPHATNLILYGPPGTGKTYETARRAVELCGETPSPDRAELMTQYRGLQDAGRIAFVTFHQSISYEDFVEGLRPVPNDEGAGFTLQPHHGIFRRIAHAASINTGPDRAPFTIGERQVFKMSLGDSTKIDQAWVFDKAMREGFAYLNFADIDWTDDAYDRRDAILRTVVDHEDAALSERSGAVKAPDLFRNDLQQGDVIIVGKGLGRFRAIGVVEGDYEYAPQPEGSYPHRRRVRWLWQNGDGEPIGRISGRQLGRETIHPMTRSDLNIAAIEQLVNEQADIGPTLPEPYVLVIDEINRANISKVFGELITLIEPDKRLGEDNAITVQLPYSEDIFGVPRNLHIIGTMNTADRSIALIDKALRRRFDFEEMMPDYDLEGMQTVIDGVTLGAILAAINARIEYLLDREHQIGHGWLIGCADRDALDDAMRKKIIPLIAEYFFEDWERTAQVLGGTSSDNPFLEKVALTVPRGMQAAGKAEHRWAVRDPFEPGAYKRLVEQNESR